MCNIIYLMYNSIIICDVKYIYLEVVNDIKSLLYQNYLMIHCAISHFIKHFIDELFSNSLILLLLALYHCGFYGFPSSLGNNLRVT